MTGRNPEEEYDLWVRDWAMFDELEAQVVQVPVDDRGRRYVQLPVATVHRRARDDGGEQTPKWAMQYRVLLDPKSNIAAAARAVHGRLKRNGNWKSLNAAFKARNPAIVDPGTGEKYRLLPSTPGKLLDAARYIDLPATLQLHAVTFDLKRIAIAQEHLDEPERDLRAIVRGEVQDGHAFLKLDRSRRDWVLTLMEIRRFLALPLKRPLGEEWTPERWAQFKRDIAR